MGSTGCIPFFKWEEAVVEGLLKNSLGAKYNGSVLFSRSLLCGCFKSQPTVRSATDILDVNVVVAQDGSSRRRRLLCATQNDATKRDAARKFDHADLTTHV